jgi:hypothetical protein
MKISTLSRVLCIAALAIVGMISLLETAQAEGIGVSFTGGSHLLAPTEEPGVVPGANWTNVVGGAGASASGLTDATGTATSASVTVNSGSTYDFFTVPMTPMPRRTNSIPLACSASARGTQHGGFDHRR